MQIIIINCLVMSSPWIPVTSSVCSALKNASNFGNILFIAFFFDMHIPIIISDSYSCTSIGLEHIINKIWKILKFLPGAIHSLLWETDTARVALQHVRQERNLSCAGSLGDGVEMALEKWVDYGHTEAEMFQAERRVWGGYACPVHWRTYVVHC